MICIVRIRGLVGVNKEIEETLYRLRLRKKFSCVIMSERQDMIGMLDKIKNYVAYGKIDKETLTELIKKRAQVVGKKKIDAELVAKELVEGKTEKKLSDFGLKDFFRLHPPRGGIETKHHFPTGILGNNKEKINELIRRML